MREEYDREKMSPLFTGDEDEAYVTSLSYGKLSLMSLSVDEDSSRYLDPGDAPLYLDLETGEAVHPSDVSSSVAAEAARHAIERSGGTTTFELKEDDERWREEFSEILDRNIDLGEGRSDSFNTPVDGSPHRHLQN